MHPIQRRLAAVLIGGIITALVAFAPSGVRGSERDLLTHFMVNQQIEVPGKVLLPNTKYVIRIFDSPSTRNLVQVLTDDEQHMLTQFMAINKERPKVEDKTVFTFIETQGGFPKPMHTWFYPGRLTGLEFVYPKDQALEIARHAKEPILATAENVSLSKLSEVKVVAIEPITGGFTSVAATAANTPAPAPAPAVTPQVSEESVQREESLPVETAQNQPEPSIKQDTEIERSKSTEPSEQSTTSGRTSSEQEGVSGAQANQAQTLPHTAGELPLVGLIGMLCFGAGIGLKVLLRRP